MEFCCARGVRIKIWANERNTGDGTETYYSVTTSKVYRDKDGQWHEVHSFIGEECLIVAAGLQKAYDYIQFELKAPQTVDA
ncbi:MAG: hypothetical protein CL908_21035 [Deltaproteobacteria bacterium]|nr:hypothetical protein [Deltaproteobacteria bacterium]